MTKQEFINRVMLIMNEAGMVDSQGSVIMGADNAQVDRYIESSYVDAWRRCIKVMPRTWFANKKITILGVYSALIKNGGTGYAVGDEITMKGETDDNCIIIVKAVSSNGAVTEVEILYPGSNYGKGEDLTVEGGGKGSGLVLSVVNTLSNITADLADGTGYITLPDDFYLLTSFKMVGWQKSVHEASLENERTSNIQTNKWTRGSEIRPVCLLSLKIIGQKQRYVLKYFSLKPGLKKHSVEEAIYVPVVKPLKELNVGDEIGLHDQIIEPLAYLLASSVFTMFEKYEISKALEQRAIEMFPGLQSVKGNTITVKQ